MILKLFTQPGCSKCPSAKTLAEHLSEQYPITIEEYNVEDADGMAEAAFYMIMSTPSIVFKWDSKDEDFNDTKTFVGVDPVEINKFLEEYYEA